MPNSQAQPGSAQFKGQDRALIFSILQTYRRLAVVGMSPKPQRPSYFAATYMRSYGYEIFPVNPTCKEAMGLPCVASLAELAQPLEIVDIFRRTEEVPAIVDEAIALGAKVIWMQLGIIHEEAAERAKAAGLQVVMDRCVKIEHARFAGGLNFVGLDTGRISARKSKFVLKH